MSAPRHKLLRTHSLSLERDVVKADERGLNNEGAEEASSLMPVI